MVGSDVEDVSVDKGIYSLILYLVSITRAAINNLTTSFGCCSFAVDPVNAYAIGGTIRLRETTTPSSLAV